jgi:hypothetical protein
MQQPMRTLPFLLLVLLFSACANHGPHAPAVDVDRLATGAHEGVSFLPPIGAGIPLSGDFDPNVDLQIVLFNRSTGDLVASFSVAEGEMEVTNDPGVEEQYHVNWDTRSAGLPNGSVVRIEVRMPHAEPRSVACGSGVDLLAGCLAFVDVQLLQSRGRAGGRPADKYVDLVNGQTLPIKVHVEVGAVQVDVGTVLASLLEQAPEHARRFIDNLHEIVNLEPDLFAYSASDLEALSEPDVRQLVRHVLHLHDGLWHFHAELVTFLSWLDAYGAAVEAALAASAASSTSFRDVDSQPVGRLWIPQTRQLEEDLHSDLAECGDDSTLRALNDTFDLSNISTEELNGVNTQRACIGQAYHNMLDPVKNIGIGLWVNGAVSNFIGALPALEFVPADAIGFGIDAVLGGVDLLGRTTYAVVSYFSASGEPGPLIIVEGTVGGPLAPMPFAGPAHVTTHAQGLASTIGNVQFVGGEAVVVQRGDEQATTGVVGDAPARTESLSPWPKSDLVVEGLVVSPASGESGTHVAVEFEVQNQGDGVANSSFASIRFSQSSTSVTSADPLLAAVSVPALARDGVASFSRQVMIPNATPEGMYYIWIIADVNSTANQSDETNDYASAGFSVIDVPATFAISAGGGSAEGLSVSALKDGGAIVTGYIERGGESTFGSTTLAAAGYNDLFVAKVNASGVWDWAARAGATGSNALGAAVSTFEDGSAVIAGHFMGSPTFGGTTLTGTSDSQMFVAKIGANGTWLWATAVGGTSFPASWWGDLLKRYGFSVSALPDGGAIVTGELTGTATLGNTVLKNVGPRDVLIARIDVNGNWVWANSANAALATSIPTLSALPDGAAIVAGNFRETMSFGETTLTADAWHAAYVARIRTDGEWEWASTTSGSVCAADHAGASVHSVSASADGSAMLAGNIRSGSRWQGGCTMLFGDASVTVDPDSIGDAFVAKIDANGEWEWATSARSYSEDQPDSIDSISVVADEGAVVTGYLDGGGTHFGSRWVYHYGPFVAKIDSNGVWEWLSTIHSSEPYFTRSRSISALPDGSAVVTGGFSGELSFDDWTLLGTRFTVFIAKVDAGGAW